MVNTVENVKFKRNKKNKIKKYSRGSAVLIWAVVIYLVLYSISVIFPIYWTVVNSLKTPYAFFEDPFWLPSEWIWENYIEAFSLKAKGQTILDMALSNVIITVPSVVFVDIFSAFAAYVFARYLVRFGSFFYKFVLVIGMLPLSASMPAMYNFLRSVGMYDQYIGIIFINSGGFGFYMLLMYDHFLGISWEYAESAQMDGANDFQIFFRIMLPQARLMLFAIAAMLFAPLWSDYTNIYLYLPSHPNLGVGLKLFTDNMESQNKWPQLFAAMLITTVPVALFTMFLNYKILDMRIETGIKG